MATLYLCPLSLIPQWFTNLGIMAGGGTLATYVAGSVSTPVTTYTDSTGLVPNANPLTLSSSGRPVSASGAPVAFWVPSGTVVKFAAFDAVGNQLDVLDNVSALGDPSSSGSLQALLASAASSNAGGTGPVAGADLVANALKSYDTFADVRAANAPTLVTGQTLNIQVQGALSVNDGLGGDFYWNATSSAADNGATVLKPNSINTAGRWLRLFSPPFGTQGTLASAATTDLGTLGTNLVSITGTTTITSFGGSASTARPLYVLGFTGALVLTNNSGILMPGGVSVVTAAGDSALALYTGGGIWQVLAFFRAASPQNGTAIINQVVTSSIALVNAVNLSAVLQPSACYLVQQRLSFTGTGGTGQGYRVSLNYSGSVFGTAVGAGVASSNGTPAAAQVGLNGVLTEAAVTSGSADPCNLDFILFTNTGGNLNTQFAQNSSSANATNLQAGSSMIVTRIF